MGKSGVTMRTVPVVIPSPNSAILRPMTEPITAPTEPAEDYDPAAPYGRTMSGRPKRKPGRKPADEVTRTTGTPSLDELREQGPVGTNGDQVPGEGDKRRRRPRGTGPAGAAPRPAGPERKPASTSVPFRAGPIAKGVNSLYRRAGRIVREFDPMIGAAIIATTQAESEDDVTVGEAWEEIARTNPRVRAFLLRLISGGAWGQLLMCHAPIMVALLMKDSVRRHLPFGNLLGALVTDEDTDQAAFGGDMQQMFDVAQQMAAEQMARMMAGANGARTSGEDVWVSDGVDGLAQP